MRTTLVALFMWLALALAPAHAAEFTAPPEVDVVFAAPPEIPPGFETVAGVNIDVHGHPEQYPLLLAIARHGSESLPRLAETLGVPLGTRVHVFVAATDDEFRAMQPGRPPEWADATAWPESATVFLRAPRARGPGARPLEQVLDHELTHVLIGRAFAPHQAPRWLHEGVAQVMAGEHDPSTVERLAKGAFTGLFTLPELHQGFPRDPQGALLAYAQSADFVSWYQAEYGDEALREIIRVLASGRTIEAAVYQSSGDSLTAVDEAYREQRAQAPLWLTGGTAVDMLWWATGVLAIVAVVVVRVRTRRRFARMAAEEAARDAMIANMFHDRPDDVVLSAVWVPVPPMEQEQRIIH